MMMTTAISLEGENDAPPPQYSISQRPFGEAVLGLSQVQPVTHQALMMMIMMMLIMMMIIKMIIMGDFQSVGILPVTDGCGLTH